MKDANINPIASPSPSYPTYLRLSTTPGPPATNMGRLIDQGSPARCRAGGGKYGFGSGKSLKLGFSVPSEVVMTSSISGTWQVSQRLPELQLDVRRHGKLRFRR